MKKSEIKQLVREAIIGKMSGLSDIGISQNNLKQHILNWVSSTMSLLNRFPIKLN